MLAPYPGVRGPVPKHTPILVDALNALGCDVVLEPWSRRHDHESIGEKLLNRAQDIPRIRRLLKAGHFDLMVVRTSHELQSLLANLPLLAATRGLVPNAVVQFHGGRSDLLVAPGHRAFKAASAALFALSDGVLLLSSEEARESQRFWPRGRFRVVANPFLPPAADGPVERRTATGPVSLLFVARLIKEKGIFETLAAFASVAEQRECTLVIVGDGPDAAEVASRVNELGLDGKVTLTGFLSGQPLLDAYRAADAFVFPSYREGFPTAITEALYAGLPIVTTRTRGMADHLAEGQNALFVAPRDSGALTTALERILDDAGLRARMSEANRAKVADFAPEAVAGQYLEALTQIIAATKNGTPATSLITE
ncbi:MAG TPA: glycosyltransferase family 4 protein [Solirubrobacteraceae bacterium]|jgi:glycosyltransferase involved in cell wall biosynthesis